MSLSLYKPNDMATTTLQKLKKMHSDKFVLAESYYSLLSVLNGLKLTEREVQLVAFAAIRGNMSYANVKQDFCNKFETSSATINNMISRMKKLGILIKEGSKIMVNPVLVLNFDNDIIMQIQLTHG
jgi:hypothetical protein